MQRAAGGFGGITVNNRAVISVPFDTPDGDITLFIGDWYKKNHTVCGKPHALLCRLHHLVLFPVIMGVHGLYHFSYST
jgi:hypothetical protein